MSEPNELVVVPTELPLELVELVTLLSVTRPLVVEIDGVSLTELLEVTEYED